ncbi:MAG: hypothetical protein HPY59_06230 [Anaerolineae bacterium]|nr:hypothetical protein [Anaerolineae bacterium]
MNSTKMMRLSVLAVCILLMTTALVGSFWQGEGSSKLVSALDGRQVELYGRGAYSNHSILRATSYIGADLAMLLVVVPLLFTTAASIKKFPKSLLVCSGALMTAFYYSISLVFGAAFNRYFLLYTALFSVTGFSFGYSVYLLGKRSWKGENQTQSKDRGTAIFLLFAGSTALIWLGMIIPALIQGDYSEFIDVNTTEPTFALDIGVIFPLFTACGIALLKQKEFGYRFTPVLLTFYSLVGVVVIMQTTVQHIYGIKIPLPQMIGTVASFIALGIVALVLNVRFMRRSVKI